MYLQKTNWNTHLTTLSLANLLIDKVQTDANQIEQGLDCKMDYTLNLP